jgi:hypothetical protein
MNRGTGLQGIETRRYVLYIEQVQRPYREGAGCTNLAAGNERGRTCRGNKQQTSGGSAGSESVPEKDATRRVGLFDKVSVDALLEFMLLRHCFATWKLLPLLCRTFISRNVVTPPEIRAGARMTPVCRVEVRPTNGRTESSVPTNLACG